MKESPLRAAVRLTVFVIVTAFMLPSFVVCAGPLRRGRRAIQIQWSRLVCRICGLRVRVFGTRHDAGPTLFVSNHVSYLDIPVLSQHIEATFVAKSEVAGWPLFGLIAKATGTVFVDRSASQARVQRQELRRRLAAGGNLLLFPEGTSTDGSGVEPFKSSLLDVVVDGPVKGGPVKGGPVEGGQAADGRSGTVVQPVSVAYPRDREGEPLTGARTDLYCWYGDMTLVPHLWRMMGQPGADVEVRFHPPARPEDFTDRKALARHCHATVAAGVAASHGAVAFS